MTATNRRTAPTSGQLVPKLRVWGATPTSRFSQKIASVVTLALLAVLWNGVNMRLLIQCAIIIPQCKRIAVPQ